MEHSGDLVNSTKKSCIQTVPSTSLPRWESLSLEHRRELVITLAAMLIKQLPNCHRMWEEVVHE